MVVLLVRPHLVSGSGWNMSASWKTSSMSSLIARGSSKPARGCWWKYGTLSITTCRCWRLSSSRSLVSWLIIGGITTTSALTCGGMDPYRSRLITSASFPPLYDAIRQLAGDRYGDVRPLESVRTSTFSSDCTSGNVQLCRLFGAKLASLKIAEVA